MDCARNTCKKELCKPVESATIASIPLGADTNAARRSHRHRDNVRNGVAQPHVANRNNDRAVGVEGTEMMRIARIRRGDDELDEAARETVRRRLLDNDTNVNDGYEDDDGGFVDDNNENGHN